MRDKKGSWALMFFILLTIPSILSAQNRPLSLSEALTQAEKAHPAAASAEATVLAERALIRSATDLPKMNVTGLLGGINIHTENDYSFNVTQSFSLPTVYRAGADYYRSREELAKAVSGLTRFGIRQNVKEVYYHIIYLKEYQKFLFTEDSLFKNYEKVVTANFNAGGTSLLEKIKAEAQVKQSEMQLERLRDELEIWHRQLRFWLNTEENITVTDTEPFILPSIVRRDLTAQGISLTEHPAVVPAQLQVRMAEKAYQWEQKKRIPDFQLGYMQQSFNQFVGIGHMIQIGVALPVFQKSYTARIQSAEYQILASKKNYELKTKEAEMQSSVAGQRVQQAHDVLIYYQTVALNQARVMLDNGTKSYSAGEISYLEYLTAQNDALQIRRNYLETVRQYNQALIGWQAWLEGR